MGPIWGRQDPGGPHVGPMNFAIWDVVFQATFVQSLARQRPPWDHEINGWNVLLTLAKESYKMTNYIFWLETFFVYLQNNSTTFHWMLFCKFLAYMKSVLRYFPDRKDISNQNLLWPSSTIYILSENLIEWIIILDDATDIGQVRYNT